MRRALSILAVSLLLTQTSGAALAAGGSAVRVSSLWDPVQHLVADVKDTTLVALLTGNENHYAATHASMPILRIRHPVHPASFDATPKRNVERATRAGARDATAMAYPKRIPERSVPDPRAVEASRGSRNTARSFAGAASPVLPLGSGISPHRVATPGTHKTVTGSRNTYQLGAIAQTGADLQAGMSPDLATSDNGSGMNLYWTYVQHAIPGVGEAGVNVGNGNLAIQTTDVNIPERGVNLALMRTYNSQSLHDVNGDDGSEPSIYGNGWTNPYDAHIVFRYNGATLSAISVYDGSGTRCDYTPTGSGNWSPCAGQHATLEVDPSNSCAYWWIQKNGEAYWFHSDNPGPSCSFAQANTGRVYAIYGRNSNNNITFVYSFSGPEKTTQEITQIAVNHSDGQSLTLNFAKFNGVNELSTATYPLPGNASQTATIRYNYDMTGDLLEVDKPGNDSAPNLSSYGVPSGDTPQTYGYSAPRVLSFACGPRATISIWQNGGTSGATDGACLHFDFNNSSQLEDWAFNGVVNPVISGSRLQQSISGGWNQANLAYFVYAAGSGTPCGTVATGTTVMCDSDGHSDIWTVDPSYRVWETQSATDTNSGPSALVSTNSWDANNNLTAYQSPVEYINNDSTSYFYDGNGNPTEIKGPSIATSMGTLRPTQTIVYDSENNAIAMCDANYNATHSGQCPTSYGSGSWVFVYDTGNPDATGVEPFGKMTDAYSPLGYHVTVSYAYNSQSEPGDYGLPTKVAGQQFTELDQQTSISPQDDISYDQYGNTVSLGKGNGNGLDTYTYNDVNWRTSTSDRDGVTSQVCYYSDGSTEATQSAIQYKLDGYQKCASNSDSFAHDADADIVAKISHFNGSETTTYVYDGLDRLVEVDTPNGGSKNRYYYDLTQNGTQSPNLMITGWSSAFAAHGNLFKTLRYFPIPGQQSATWNDVKGNSFDGLDRPMARFQPSPGNSGAMSKWQTAYDQNDQYGLPTSVTDPLTVVSTYTYNLTGFITGKSYSDGSPSVTTVPDPFGHVGKTTSSATGSETYQYDANGDLLSYAEGSGSTVLNPTTTYGYYPNGWRSSLTITAGSLFPSTPEFEYIYRADGMRTQLTVAGETNPFTWGYSPGGRPQSQSDPETGNPIYGTGYTLQSKTQSFDLSGSNPTGLLTAMQFPVGAKYTGVTHDAEGEPTAFNVAPSPAFSTNQNPSPYVSAAQIGYESQGRFTTLSGTSPALVQSGNGPYQAVTNMTYQYGRPETTSVDPYTGSTTVTQLPSGNCTQGNTYIGIPVLGFDADGRQTSETTLDCSRNAYTSQERSYTADNSTATDTSCTDVQNGCTSGGSQNSYAWAASGVVRTFSSGAQSYRFHWDNGQLLFVTDNQGKLVQLNVESLAVACYSNNSQTAFIVYDRDFSGTYVDEHGSNGDTGLNVMPDYTVITNEKFGFTSTYLDGSFPAVGKPLVTSILFDAPRIDGNDIGHLTVQGDRAYDASLSQWTTPDSNSGTVDAPLSQWSYAWNAGNPLMNVDVTGNDAVSNYVGGGGSNAWSGVMVVMDVEWMLVSMEGALVFGGAEGAVAGAIAGIPIGPADVASMEIGATMGAAGAEYLYLRYGLPIAVQMIRRDWHDTWNSPEQAASLPAGPPGDLMSQGGAGWTHTETGSVCNGGISTCAVSGVQWYYFEQPAVPGDNLAASNYNSIEAALGFGEDPIEWATGDACAEYDCYHAQ